MTGAETRGRLAILAFFLFRMPRKPLEYIISVDLSNIWRQHLGMTKDVSCFVVILTKTTLFRSSPHDILILMRYPQSGRRKMERI